MSVQIEIAGRLHEVQVETDSNGVSRQVVLDGEQLTVEATLLRPGVLSLLIGGRAYCCVLENDPAAPAIHVGGHLYPYRVEDPRSLNARRRGKGGPTTGPVSIKAPMPGRIVRLMAAEGDEVADQQGIVVIEAMKMQNELKAPKAGRVIRIHVDTGATVVSGQPLAVID